MSHHAKRTLLCLPVCDDLIAGRRHAVDLPVQLAVLVAYLNREAAVIGANQLDVLAELTLDGQLFFLARVKSALAALLLLLLLLLYCGRSRFERERRKVGRLLSVLAARVHPKHVVVVLLLLRVMAARGALRARCCCVGQMVG